MMFFDSHTCYQAHVRWYWLRRSCRFVNGLVRSEYVVLFLFAHRSSSIVSLINRPPAHMSQRRSRKVKKELLCVIVNRGKCYLT